MTAWIALFAPALAGDVGIVGEHARQHAEHAGEEARYRAPSRRALPDPTPGPDVRVYGYQAYWADDLGAVPWDHLSDLAIFAAEVDSAGNLSSTSRWEGAADAVAMAAPYGVRVHLCVINFDTDSLETLLGSETARRNLIDQLGEWQDRTGAHGVNIDFEGLPSSRKQQMVDFTADLQAEAGEVVLATPAVDWSGAWDYSELSKHADLFVMGYGYHWSGSSQAGPVDPLYGGGVWGEKALDWTIDDYLANGADPERVILGLPLYGYVWPVASGDVPADATGDADAIFWAEAQAKAATHGRRYDEGSRTPYWYGAGEQGWYGDADSLRERTKHAVGKGIGGIGFWALHYDDADQKLWDAVREETVFQMPATPEEFTADAGLPFLAYVGDHIILSGAGSTGPEGVDLEYLWNQTAGPRVLLSDDGAVEPEFDVEAPGVHAFELRVGDGETFSAPVKSYVVVIDPAAGERHAEQGGCGCATGAPTSAWAVFVGVIASATARRARVVRSRANAGTGARGRS
jgi:hypothetical protein